MARGLVLDFNEKALKLAEKFWPGPLTILLDKSEIVPDVVTAGLGSVCIRMPNHKVALEIIEGVGRPLAAPSANKSGRPSPTSLDQVFEDLPSVSGVDGGFCEVGIESTVLSLIGGVPKILRVGGVSREELEEVLGEVVEIVEDLEQKKASPGALFKHYSPKGEVVLIYPWEEFGEKFSKKMKSAYPTVETAIADFYENYKCGVVCVESRFGLYEGYEVLSLGSGVAEQARNLYSVLRESEKLGWEKVVVDMTGVGDDEGLGLAIIERLKKAASKD